MGAILHLRWVAIGLAAWLAAATPAVAQSPLSPDAAPSSSSSSLTPDSDPGTSKPAASKPAASKPAASKPAPKKPAVVVQRRLPAERNLTPAPATREPAASTPAETPRQTTTSAAEPVQQKPAAHRKNAARRAHDAPATNTVTHAASLSAPSLPRVIPARLVAPANADDGRAGKLAAAALSLLVLALLSAMLLAFAARAERGRMAR